MKGHFSADKKKPNHILNAEFAKDIMSFANTVRDESAYILIGVKELPNKTGEIVGVDEADILDQAQYQQKIKDLLDPIPRFNVFSVYVDHLQVRVIEIPIENYSSPIKPTKTVANILNKRDFYVRKNTSNEPATYDDTIRLDAWLKSIPKNVYFKNKKENKAKISGFSFSEEAIQRLFGNEAAEDEDPERLREYYFKNDTFDRIKVNLPLRILVGHKGIGKSALFRVASLEDKDKGILPLFIKPDDVAGLGQLNDDFIEIVRSWKYGLYKIILSKILNAVGIREKIDLDYSSIGDHFDELVYDKIEALLESSSVRDRYKSVLEKILDKGKINIYIDDLDRGWSGSKTDITKISALLNAVRDISNTNRQYQFKLSLRSDVYYLVRTSDESTDKIEGSVIWFKWTYDEILALLAKRVLTFFGNDINDATLNSSSQSQLASHLDKIINPTFEGRGRWSNTPSYKVLISVIRKRPRDLVKILTLAARNCRDRKSNYISTQDFEAVFEQYSLDRIQDTVNEYRSELPAIERLILGMKPRKKRGQRFKDIFYFTTSELLLKIRNITERGQFRLSKGGIATEKELAAFLYKINFITATKTLESGRVDRKDFEDNKYLVPKFEDFGYDWEVHMAYRWGLQPSSEDDIFSNL